MYGQFFSQFLHEKGCLSPQQIKDTVAYQSEVNRPLGVLAMDYGYLTGAQVESILEKQKQMDMSFGEIARREGLLGDEQLSLLLRHQMETHVYFAEALVQKGFASYPDVERYLEEFNHANRDIAAEILRELDELPHNETLVRLLETCQRIFSRAVSGHMKVLSRTECASPGLADRVIVVRKALNPSGELNFGFILDRVLLRSFLYCLLRKVTHSDRVINDTLFEFTRALSYGLDLSLEREGRAAGETEISIGDSTPGFYDEATCFTMTSTVGDFTFFCLPRA